MVLLDVVLEGASELCVRWASTHTQYQTAPTYAPDCSIEAQKYLVVVLVV